MRDRLAGSDLCAILQVCTSAVPKLLAHSLGNTGPGTPTQLLVFPILYNVPAFVHFIKVRRESHYFLCHITGHPHEERLNSQ